MKFLLNLLRGCKVARLKQASANVKNVFSQTINDLQSINAEMEAHDMELTEKVNDLTKKRTELRNQWTANGALMKKLENFIS